ncbi:MAG: 4Fe-4S dicluster domain-containing protein [Candidatus Omnitrophota bacterium]|nr:MAG: 4Fe-4S dicluster domain-containing protein [Candidatus Omnitrophota bacterium]
MCRCGAIRTDKERNTLYDGPSTCRAAVMVGGVIDCKYGCVGLGDCVKVCPTGALALSDEKISVDMQKCIGCGNCVKACPRILFQFVPPQEHIYSVACNNIEGGGYVKTVCKKGCIACGICAQVSDSPFFMKGNLSYIDYGKAKLKPQEEAKGKCPTKCIVKINA